MDERIITRPEYLAALDIVEAYHKQLKDSGNKVKLTPIREWVDNEECSVRLRNILLAILDGRFGYREYYIEDVDLKKMLTVRNCGRRSINELIGLRGY